MSLLHSGLQRKWSLFSFPAPFYLFQATINSHQGSSKQSSWLRSFRLPTVGSYFHRKKNNLLNGSNPFAASAQKQHQLDTVTLDPHVFSDFKNSNQEFPWPLPRDFPKKNALFCLCNTVILEGKEKVKHEEWSQRMELLQSPDPFPVLSHTLFSLSKSNHNSAFASIAYKTVTTFREQDSHDVVKILWKQAWNLQKSYKSELNQVLSYEDQLCMA